MKCVIIGLLLCLCPPQARSQAEQELPIAKDIARLGDVRADLAESAGKAVESGPSYDLYFNNDYFFMVGFEMPLVSGISYFRATDANLYIDKRKNRDWKECNELMVILKPDEIEKFLNRHTVDTSGVKHSWKQLKEGRWERGDGVMATLHNDGKVLMIVTKELWPKLVLDAPSSYSYQDSDSDESRMEEMVNLLKAADVPILFHGMVIDEHGQGLPGAEVSWSVLKGGVYNPALGLPTGAKGVAKTDAAGRFSITENGFNLSIQTVQKEGCREAQRTVRDFSYRSNADTHEPNETEPERFLMVKNDTPRSTRLEVPLQFNWDGTSSEFQIGSKDFSETLILTATREAQEPNKRGFNWKLVLKVKGGQLTLGEMGDVPLAPEAGYVDEIVLKDDAGPSWRASTSDLLYIKTGSGKFAEIKIMAYADRGDGYLDIRWNPTGDRAFK